MTQTKTFTLKALLLTLLLVPAMFLFSACGSQLDSNATVNISGTYAQTTEDNDFGTFLADEETISDFESGMHITMTMKNMEITEGVLASMYINVYIKYDIDEVEGTATLSELAAKISVTNESTHEQQSATMYITGGYIYMSMEGQNLKSEVPDSLSEVFGLSFIDGLGSDELLGYFIGEPDAFDVKIAVSGVVTKYHLIIKEGYSEEIPELANSELYFVFNDNFLSGIYMSAEMGGGSAEVSLVGFYGDIQYPDFSGYTDAS